MRHPIGISFHISSKTTKPNMQINQQPTIVQNKIFLVKIIQQYNTKFKKTLNLG
jgi:hypothetical protein